MPEPQPRESELRLKRDARIRERDLLEGTDRQEDKEKARASALAKLTESERLALGL